jgi:membrane-bound ClpP family serine protease
LQLFLYFAIFIFTALPHKILSSALFLALNGYVCCFFSATSIGFGSLDSLFIFFFLKGFLKMPLPAHRTHAFLYILSFSRQFHLSLPYLTFGFPEAFYIS